MIKKLLPGLLLIVSSCSFNDNRSNNEKITDGISIQKINTETEYITIRDNYVKYFETIDFDKVDWSNPNDSILIQEKKARIDLENRLKRLIDFSKVNERSDPKINLATLFQEYGFGLMDGLIFNNDSIKVFCTTVNIFQNFNQNEKLKLDKLNLRNLEQILNKVFYYDAHISLFYLDKKIAQSGNASYGILGSLSQDWVYTPSFIYTVSFIGEQIFITEQELTSNISRIDECYSLMDSINSKSPELIDKYYSSGEIDSTIINSTIKLDDFANSKYCECFNIKFPGTPQFENIKSQIDKIVNYIQE